MQIFVITFIIFSICVFAMSIGVLFGNRCIHGSCGGMDRLRNMFGGNPCESCAFKETQETEAVS